MSDSPTRWNSAERATATTTTDAATALITPANARVVKSMYLRCTAGDVYVGMATVTAANSIIRISAGERIHFDDLNIAAGTAIQIINAVAGQNSTVEVWVYGIQEDD